MDRNPTTDPTICMDIMDWDYKAAFQPGEVEIIYCSPPNMEIPSKFCDKKRYIDSATALVQESTGDSELPSTETLVLGRTASWMVEKGRFYGKYSICGFGLLSIFRSRVH